MCAKTAAQPELAPQEPSPPNPAPPEPAAQEPAPPKPALEPAKPPLDREAKLREIFTAADFNTDGNISVEEFKALAASQSSIALSMQEAVFGMVDANSDGTLSIDEFVKFNLLSGAAVDDATFLKQADAWLELAKTRAAPEPAAPEPEPVKAEEPPTAPAEPPPPPACEEAPPPPEPEPEPEATPPPEPEPVPPPPEPEPEPVPPPPEPEPEPTAEPAPEPEPAAPTYTSITLTAMAAFGVPDGDLRKGSGKSDPYLKFTLLMDGPDYDGTGPLGGKGGPTVQCEKIANDANPVWEGQTLTLEVPAPFSDGAELRVRLWDDDVTNEDDAIGSTVVTLSASGAGAETRVTCKGREQQGTAGYVLPDFDVAFTYVLA